MSELMTTRLYALVKAERDAALARLAAAETVLRGCLSYFELYDQERTDGRTSPIIGTIRAVLVADPAAEETR